MFYWVTMPGNIILIVMPGKCPRSESRLSLVVASYNGRLTAPASSTSSSTAASLPLSMIDKEYYSAPHEAFDIRNFELSFAKFDATFP